MKNINLKATIWLILGSAAIFWFLIAYLSGFSFPGFIDYLKPIPTVVTIEFFLVLIFIRWGWKFRIFKNWLVPFPNLNGTWQGHIESTWINDKTGKTLPDIPAILTIQQTFIKISCVIRTAEMTSHSYSGEFRIESDNQVRQIIYSYTSKPRTTVTDRSPIHDGTIVFDIIGDPVKKLKGQYWTTRKTTGETTMTFRCKELFDEFPNDIK